MSRERSRPGRPPRTVAGFTLLEVLVALALLALVFAAALEAAARTTADTAYLRDRTFAMWVAANELTRAALLPDGPAEAVERGVSLMGTREWAWEMRVTDTDDASVRKVEVRVAGDDNERLAQMTGYALRRLEPRAAAAEPGSPEAGAEGGAPEEAAGARAAGAALRRSLPGAQRPPGATRPRAPTRGLESGGER